VIVPGLDGDAYSEHGAFGPGDVAASRLAPSLTIDGSAPFDAR